MRHSNVTNTRRATYTTRLSTYSIRKTASSWHVRAAWCAVNYRYGDGTVVSMAAAGRGSNYHRMRPLSAARRQTFPPICPGHLPPYCRHLPLRQIFNIFRRKNVLINIFLNEKTFMCGFKFLEAIPKHFLRQIFKHFS